jgi:hypothetical protein
MKSTSCQRLFDPQRPANSCVLVLPPRVQCLQNRRFGHVRNGLLADDLVKRQISIQDILNVSSQGNTNSGWRLPR